MSNKKSIILNEAIQCIDAMLKPLSPIEFEGAKLYVVDLEFYKEVLKVDETLMPLRTDSRRGQAYSIDKIVTILNPEDEAFQYNLTAVWKSSLVTDQGKCFDRLAAEKDISINKINKRVKDKIIEDDLDDDAAQSLKDVAALKIKDEKEEFDKIKANPEKYHLIISTYKERKSYGQIAWGYYDKDKKKKKGQRHLSITYPNLLIYNEDLEIDTHRTDMMVAKFIKEGYRALGNVFVKLKA